MANPSFLNFLEGTLNTALTSTDATINVAVAQKFQKNDGTFYDLVDDKTTSLVTDIELTVNHLNNTKVELIRCSGITQSGTTADGRPIYTLTVETTGATKLRGMANSYDGTTATGNVIANNTIAQFPKNSPCRIAVNTGSLQRAIDLFTATTGEDSGELGETVADNEVVAIQDSDGKIYLFDSTDSNRDVVVGIMKTGQGGSSGATAIYTTLNGRNTGHTGLTKGERQFASIITPGAITETPTDFLLGIADATGTIINTGISSSTSVLTDALIIAGTSTIDGSVSPKQLVLSQATGLIMRELCLSFVSDTTNDYVTRFTGALDNGGTITDGNGVGMRLNIATTGDSFAAARTESPQITLDNTISVNMAFEVDALTVDTQQAFIGFTEGTTPFTSGQNMKTTNIKQVGFLIKRESGTINIYSVSADSSIELNDVGDLTSGGFFSASIVYTATSIFFYLEGVLVATHTTDIPSDSTKGHTVFYAAAGTLSSGAVMDIILSAYNFRQYLS